MSKNVSSDVDSIVTALLRLKFDETMLVVFVRQAILFSFSTKLCNRMHKSMAIHSMYSCANGDQKECQI